MSVVDSRVIQVTYGFTIIVGCSKLLSKMNRSKNFRTQLLGRGLCCQRFSPATEDSRASCLFSPLIVTAVGSFQGRLIRGLQVSKIIVSYISLVSAPLTC